MALDEQTKKVVRMHQESITASKKSVNFVEHRFNPQSADSPNNQPSEHHLAEISDLKADMSALQQQLETLKIQYTTCQTEKTALQGALQEEKWKLQETMRENSDIQVSIQQYKDEQKLQDTTPAKEPFEKAVKIVQELQLEMQQIAVENSRLYLLLSELQNQVQTVLKM